MRVSSLLLDAGSRKVVLGGIALLGLLSAVFGWIAAGALAGIATALVWLVVGGTVKVVAELGSRTVATEQASGAVQSAVARHFEEHLASLRASEAAVNETASSIKDLAERVDGVERGTKEQTRFNEAILNRTRNVEQSTSDQTKFNEAILNRTRNVEKATNDQTSFNEAILNRIRELEEAAAAEPRRNAHRDPSGRERNERLERGRRLVTGARSAAAATGAPELSSGPRLSDPGDRTEQAPSLDGSTVTIVVPCHNEETYVAAALESVLRQTYPDWECIVVDDASTDASLSEVQRIAAGDDRERFRVLRHEARRGVAAARNTGLSDARGDLVTFLDADDLLMADSLLDRVEAFASKATPDTAGVFCGVGLVDEDVALSDFPAWEPWDPPGPFLDFVSSDGENRLNTHAPLVRTDVARAHDGFREELPDTGEDRDFWDRIMRSGYIFVPSAHRTAVYRQRPGSHSRLSPLEQMEGSTALIGSAYAEAPGSQIRGEIRFPFPRPLSHYRRLLTTSRRAVLFAAMALIQSDGDGAKKIVATLERGSWPLLERHIDFGWWARSGFQRGLGLSSDDLDDLDQDLEPLERTLVAMIRFSTEPAAPSGS